MKLSRIKCVVAKEFAQILRDHNLVRLLVVAPLIQLLVMGFAATTDIREIRLAVRDNDHSWHSRELYRALGASGYFKTFPATGPENNDASLLVSSKAGLVLVIPEEFGERILKRAGASLQVLVDGSDSNFGVQGLGYLQKAIRLYTAGLEQEGQGHFGRSSIPSVAVESRVWYNPGLVSRVYMVPAIMALLLLVTTMLITSMALVKERENGTMEQLIVTPLRPGEIIAGKLLPFVLIGFIELAFAILVIRFVFLIQMRGNILSLLVLSLFFLLTTLGLGLFISTLVKTQQQAMLIAAFFVMMPFVLLSGFAFPVENMPRSMQAFTALIPLKYYLLPVRGIYLKGQGWPEFWPQALALLAWGGSILGIAVVNFRKKLD
jgi:ABC-2 type transport system permease protein